MSDQQHENVREIVGLNGVARAFGISRQAVHGQLKRGSCVLRPVGRDGNRLYFDRAQVERAAKIINPPKP